MQKYGNDPAQKNTKVLTPEDVKEKLVKAAQEQSDQRNEDEEKEQKEQKRD